MATVRMFRDDAPKGNRFADVHPDEVANMRSLGWSVVEEKEAKAEPKPAKKTK